MLRGGGAWAVQRGFGAAADLRHVEEQGCMRGARPEWVSARAKRRQEDEMGTLGSGNHYLEVQRVAEVRDQQTAASFGLRADDIVVSIHCGSRGLGHQIGTEFLREMVSSPETRTIDLPDRELACAPVHSEIGQRYLGAMRAGINCALANRQIITHLVRQAFADVLPDARLDILYDVSHNTCKLEEHACGGASHPSVRPPQRRHALARSWASRPARASSALRAACPHRGHDGHGVLCARRHRRE